jgi:hypothetical protein
MGCIIAWRDEIVTTEMHRIIHEGHEVNVNFKLGCRWHIKRPPSILVNSSLNLGGL